ncbi:MAG: hypothetical protein JNK05_16445 [Myxococcales bacterium]|nr:hypothetical protein [Myxococcales bacterium]
MRTSNTFRAALVALALSLAGSSAVAQSAAPSDVAAILRQANAAHDATDYGTALSLYQQAYTINNDPFVLFNIGRMNLLLRRYEAAQSALRRFVERVPDAPNRGVVEALLREASQGIEGQRAEQAAQRQAELERQQREEQLQRARRTVDTTQPRPSRPAWPWALVAVAGGAALGAGVSAGLYAAAANDLYTPAVSGCDTATSPIRCPDTARARDLYASAQRAGGAIVGLSIGAVALGVASAVAFVVTAPRAEPRATVSATVDAHGGSMLVRGSF